MNVVAGRARHGARLEATAGCQQLNLVAVNVDGHIFVRKGDEEVLIDRLSGNEGQRRPFGLRGAGMAQGAGADLPVAGERSWIQNGGLGSRMRRIFGAVESNMLAAGA